ncbi:MAG: hypothetical protein HY360_17675, partial [Verrucomicrobia bacterium]|nr:hypothetical protein [Verrucomicrobiota bacterium]
WQHVAFVRKEDEVAIYHNGQPVAQGIVKQPKLEEGKDPEEMEIMVGAAIVSGHAFYVGLMDDFVLLDYALDASQIKKLAEEGWEKFAASDPKFKK